MSRWVDVKTRHGGGGGPKVTYETIFFHLLRRQLLMVDDYAYAKSDFKDDPNLPL